MNFKELHVHGQIHLRKWASLIDPIQRWPTSMTTGHHYCLPFTQKMLFKRSRLVLQTKTNQKPLHQSQTSSLFYRIQHNHAC